MGEIIPCHSAIKFTLKLEVPYFEKLSCPSVTLFRLRNAPQPGRMSQLSSLEINKLSQYSKSTSNYSGQLDSLISIQDNSIVLSVREKTEVLALTHISIFLMPKYCNVDSPISTKHFRKKNVEKNSFTHATFINLRSYIFSTNTTGLNTSKFD